MSVHVDHIPIRTLLLDFVGGPNPIYMGFANPGMSTDNTGWQIRKITYDAASNPVEFRFAGGSAGFEWSWDQRMSYSYT